MHMVNIYEAKTHFSKLIDSVLKAYSELVEVID